MAKKRKRQGGVLLGLPSNLKEARKLGIKDVGRRKAANRRLPNTADEQAYREFKETFDSL